jgi:hypothetical protein
MFAPHTACVSPGRSRLIGRHSRGNTEVPVLQGKLGIATSKGARAGRHSVGEAYFVVDGSAGIW